MVNYHDVNSKEAVNPFKQLVAFESLPLLKSAKPIATMFDDSTHQLWYCDTEVGELVLKLCHHEQLQYSPTWQIMRQLFDLSLPEELAYFRESHARLERASILPVPDLVACAGQVGQSPAFILSRAVEGSPIFAAGVTDEMVCQLAKQVATLHSFSQSTWGKLSQPSKQAKQWQEKLSQTLQLTTCMQGQEAWIYQAMTEIEQLNTETFAPVMLDNRWDQYLSKHGRMTALVDLDAFVIAPPELELVLLEYQLNDKQASLFKKEYEQLRPFPDLSQQRIAYRLLLFLMNAMGETNIERSMQAKTHW